MNAKKLIVFVLLAFVAIFAAWMIFSPQPEKYEYESTTTNSNADSGSPYTNETFGFEVTVPNGFTVDESYLNQDLGPGREIPGVAFRIPRDMSSGTNLSSDSYAAIEELSDVDCSPSTFIDSPTGERTVTMGNNSYTVASTTGAAAGNLYEEIVHVIQKDNKCYDVRYLIHSTNIGNYEPGAVTAYDREKLLSYFDTLSRTLLIH